MGIIKYSVIFWLDENEWKNYLPVLLYNKVTFRYITHVLRTANSEIVWADQWAQIRDAGTGGSGRAIVPFFPDFAGR